MPNMDGFALLEQVKELSPETPVYMCSAYESVKYIRKSRTMGAEGYLTKPIDFDELRQTIEAVKTSQ